MDEYASIAEYYDHVGIYRDRPDVDFWVEAALQAGSPILELGCGSGRVLIPTARAGIDIVGLDASPSMLAVCRANLAAEPPAVRARVNLALGDMRAFDLGQSFTLVTLPFRPFQHLVTVGDQLACLASVRRSLLPGGRVILDLFNPSLERLTQPVGVESAPESEFTMPDGRRVVRRFCITSHDRAEQVNHVQLIYDVQHTDGRSERQIHEFAMRYLFRYEAEHLLERSGFRVLDVYSGYDKHPFGATYPGDLILVAEARGAQPL